VIRPARVDDIPQLIAIEVASGELFLAIGMDSVAQDPPMPAEQFASFIESATAFVEVDTADKRMGYILVEPHEHRAFIEQVTILPRHAHHGIGAALIMRAEGLARHRGLSGLLLTTYRDVPWNAPYYARLGFDIVDESQWTPWMTARVALEASRGLAIRPRVIMAR
jgi:GNAT superfamily N-acetyltransferase